jgi:uncharacterized damage-inducible protein DinB
MSLLAAEFLRQNNWANLVLIDFLARLPDETLDAGAPGTYGTLRDTVLHMVGSLSFYHIVLTGAAPEPDSIIDPSEPWPGYDAVRAAAEGWGKALEALAERSPHAWPIEAPYDEDYEPGMSAAVPLVQVVNHCTDHRSQIATMLTQMGIEPPELDSWAWGLATGLAVERRG